MVVSAPRENLVGFSWCVHPPSLSRTPRQTLPGPREGSSPDGGGGRGRRGGRRRWRRGGRAGETARLARGTREAPDRKVGPHFWCFRFALHPTLNSSPSAPRKAFCGRLLSDTRTCLDGLRPLEWLHGKIPTVSMPDKWMSPPILGAPTDCRQHFSRPLVYVILPYSGING